MNKKPDDCTSRLPPPAEHRDANPSVPNASLLVEAYKKHSSELIAIDTQQTGLLTIILGIFGAGATFLGTKAGENFSCNERARTGLAIVVFSVLWLWTWYVAERHKYRQAVRRLLVRCESAMGFYKANAYLTGERMYGEDECKFPTKGRYIFWTNLLTVYFAATGFLFVLKPPMPYLMTLVGIATILLSPLLWKLWKRWRTS